MSPPGLSWARRLFAARGSCVPRSGSKMVIEALGPILRTTISARQE